MSKHPHGEKISAYLDGMLDVAQSRDIAAHLSSCVECKALHKSLNQTKSLLQRMEQPTQPGVEFWNNSYRRLRTDNQNQVQPVDWASLRANIYASRKKLSAGLAALAVIGAFVAGPYLTHNSAFQLTPITVTPTASSQDTVNVATLVQAHTESAAKQPLADTDRQDMIAMDSSVNSGNDGPIADSNDLNAFSTSSP